MGLGSWHRNKQIAWLTVEGGHRDATQAGILQRRRKSKAIS
jgi:hypothetical protein